MEQIISYVYRQELTLDLPRQTGIIARLIKLEQYASDDSYKYPNKLALSMIRGSLYFIENFVSNDIIDLYDKALKSYTGTGQCLTDYTHISGSVGYVNCSVHINNLLCGIYECVQPDIIKMMSCDRYVVDFIFSMPRGLYHAGLSLTDLLVIIKNSIWTINKQISIDDNIHGYLLVKKITN